MVMINQVSSGAVTARFNDFIINSPQVLNTNVISFNLPADSVCNFYVIDYAQFTTSTCSPYRVRYYWMVDGLSSQGYSEVGWYDNRARKTETFPFSQLSGNHTFSVKVDASCIIYASGNLAISCVW